MNTVDLSRDKALFDALERHHLTREGDPTTEISQYPVSADFVGAAGSLVLTDPKQGDK